MIVGWEALHMKKNYDDEQENTTAYRVRLLRRTGDGAKKSWQTKYLLPTPKSADWKVEKPQISAALC